MGTYTEELSDSVFNKDFTLQDGKRLKKSSTRSLSNKYTKETKELLDRLNIDPFGDYRHGSKSYYNNTMGIQITKRYRGSKDLINKLQSLDDAAWEALFKCVKDWAYRTRYELMYVYPRPYDKYGGDERFKLWEGHSYKYWKETFSIGATGIQANIWNEQLSRNGFDYVSDINTYGHNWQGVPYRTPAGFVNKVLDKQSAKKQSKLLVRDLQAAIKELGL